MSHTDTNLADQAFVERFTAAIDAQAASAAATIAPADTPAPAADAPDAPASEPESASAASAADAADEDAQDPPTTDDAPAPAAAPATAPESDDDADDEDDDAEEDTDDAGEEQEDAPSAEFAAALEREGAKLTLDDVPEAARPFVQQRVRELEAGFTKARQRDTQQLVELKSELRFQQSNPADHIAAQLRTDPTLADKVNALLEEFERSPTAARAHDVVVEDARAKARTAEQQAVADVDARQREAEALDAHLETRLAEHGVKPGKALQRMLNDRAALAKAQTGTVALTQADIDEIVADYAADVAAEKEHARRLQKRADRRRYVADKTADRKTAGLVVRPSAGAPAAPPPPPKPANDEEFANQFAARLDAQRRSA